MGQSTNAILFYGYCWEDETSKPWTIGDDSNEDDSDSDDEDWEERYAKVMGAKQPVEKWPDSKRDPKTYDYVYTAEQQLIVDEYLEFWAKKREIAGQSGCEVDTHCSGECPMPFVAIKASKKLAYRGGPVEIDEIAVDVTWADQLADFCAKMGIRTDGLRLGWWLVSDWN